MTSSTWHLGIDAGGTTTELLALSPGDESKICLAGPGANLQRSGLDATCDVLARLVMQFRRKVGSVTAHLCAGIAGAGRAEDQRAVRTGLRRRLGRRSPDHVAVVHDGEIALEAAFEGESGVVTIAGTGSIVLARTREHTVVRAGGWGYLLGDDGSGYALGRAGLRAVAAQYDSGSPTLLTALLEARHQITSNAELIQKIYGDDWQIQEVAPLVIEAAAAGDTTAQQIVQEAVLALARQVRWLAESDAPINPQVAPLGGLLNEPYYRDRLFAALRRTLPGWVVDTPIHTPVVGAVLLARRVSAMYS